MNVKIEIRVQQTSDLLSHRLTVENIRYDITY